MIRWLRASGACGVLLLVALVLDVHAAELPASGHCTIEALIQHVEHLTDAVFIRNNKAWLLLDSRVVDRPMASTPNFVMLSSLKPLFINGLKNALCFSDNAGA